MTPDSAQHSRSRWPIDIARIICQRRNEQGVRTLFGVRSMSCIALVEAAVVAEREIVQASIELEARYAAAGSARRCGLGVVSVPNRVGNASLVNAIAGPDVGRTAMIVLNGATSTTDVWRESSRRQAPRTTTSA